MACSPGQILKRHILTCLIILSVGSAIGLGFLIRIWKVEWTERELMYIGFPGELFLQMLRSLIIPLITTSIILAVASLDISKSKKIGCCSIVFYLASTVVAIQVGLVLVATIQPGNFVPDDDNSTIPEHVGPKITISDTFLDLFRNFFPPNWLQATMFLYKTKLHHPPGCTVGNCTDMTEWKISGSYVRGMNIPGLVALSFFIGISTALLKGKVELLKTLIREINYVSMKITSWVVWFSPIGVFFLILSRFVSLDISIMLQQMGLFFITVVLGMAIHMALIMPLVSFLLTRKNPYKFIGNMGEALAMAFGTASSSATLPLTMNCCQENNGIHPKIVNFVIPIGATINMNGTALYEAVAAVFISQVRGTALDFSHYVMISLTTTAASVGAAGIPQAGVVTMVMVLDAIGLPPEDISLVIAVDWILDRLRTIVNVLGDAFGAQVVDHLCREELSDDEYDPEGQPVDD